MKVAHISMDKVVQEDNWYQGCSVKSWFTYDEHFTVEFEDTADLKEKLADWVSNNFDIHPATFLKYVTNEVENNRFDYSQNEDGEANHKIITEEDPDGYLADYHFYISQVTAPIEYTF